MNTYQTLGVVLALCLYLPIAFTILFRNGKQNVGSWILWWTLDLIAAGSMYVQGGNYYLPLGYMCGCTFILLCLLKKRIFHWTRFETTVSCMVAVCVLGWIVSGPRLAVILSSLATAIASTPQLRQIWKDPWRMPPSYVFAGYIVANAFSVAGGKSWIVEERFFPVVCLVMSMASTYASLRRHFVLRQTASF